MTRKTLFFCSALLLATIVLMSHLDLVQGQRFAPGFCPNVPGQENFDKSKFFGNWIEVEKTPSIFDLMMRCMVVDYSDDKDNTVNVVVRGVSLAGLPLTVNGDGLESQRMELADQHRSGFYLIRYGFGVPFQGTLTTIVDTDYQDYAVVYSCTNSLLSGVFHTEYIWLLSRSGKISNPTRQNIYEKLDKLNINRSGLTMSDRSTCPTNSTAFVGRESEKNDLVQPLIGGSSSGSAQSANASPVSGESASSSPGQKDSNLSQQSGADKASSEAAPAKSQPVPLLYDLPTPINKASKLEQQKQANAKQASSAQNSVSGKSAAIESESKQASEQQQQQQQPQGDSNKVLSKLQSSKS